MSIIGDTKFDHLVKEVSIRSFAGHVLQWSKGLKPIKWLFMSSYVVIFSYPLRKQPAILHEIAEAKSGGVLGPQITYKNNLKSS